MTFDIPDVDLDVAYRDEIMSMFGDAVHASLIQGDDLRRHLNGLYFQDVPTDPVTGLSAYPYQIAEAFGFYKIDFLANPVYAEITDPEHLDELLARNILWEWFTNPQFVRRLFHFNGMVEPGLSMAEVVTHYAPRSVPEIAALLAIKLPAKRYLIGEPWDVILSKIWIKEKNDLPYFKQAHSVAYALCVIVDAHLKAPEFFV